MPVSTRTMARTITEAKGGLQRDQSPVHQHRLLRRSALDPDLNLAFRAEPVDVGKVGTMDPGPSPASSYSA
jgi:hypothetical protein